MDYPYLDPDLGTIDGRATSVVPETVGQYVGLTDKNGTKIFEGDIVEERWWSGSKRVTVRWEDVSCGFEPFSDSLENCGHCGGGMMSESCVVVGNIHDNPELISGVSS